MKLPEKPVLLAQSGEKLELAGNREATVDGCGGVLEYTEEAVRIRYGRGVLRFLCRGLTLHSLAVKTLVVTGYITEIDYAARGEMLPVREAEKEEP